MSEAEEVSRIVGAQQARESAVLNLEARDAAVGGGNPDGFEVGALPRGRETRGSLDSVLCETRLSRQQVAGHCLLIRVEEKDVFLALENPIIVVVRLFFQNVLAVQLGDQLIRDKPRLVAQLFVGRGGTFHLTRSAERVETQDVRLRLKHRRSYFIEGNSSFSELPEAQPGHGQCRLEIFSLRRERNFSNPALEYPESLINFARSQENHAANVIADPVS